MMRSALVVLAYMVPTFALGFAWHLVLFDSYYKALAIYRADIIIPFGFLSILIQAMMHRRAGDLAVARRHAVRALASAPTDAVRDLLRRRLAEAA